MNLLHVTPYYAPAWSFGGVVQAVKGLAEAQAASGHTVIVLTTDALDRTSRLSIVEEELNGVRVIRRRNWSQWLRGSLNLSTPAGFGAEAQRLLLEHRVDLIHCHELRTTENWLVAAPARRLRIPIVLSPHGTLPYATGNGPAKRAWDHLVGRRLVSAVAHVLALTQAEASDARQLWSRLGTPLRDDQLSIIPNGVDLSEFDPAPGAGSFRRQWGLGEGTIILFLGRLAERKGLRTLVSAFARLAGIDPGARLVMAGPDWGLRPALQVQIRQSRLEGKVVLTGSLTQAARLEALRAADVFVLPATGEGLSMAALEAMASGLPVVLSEGCNFPQVAARGAGLVVAPATDPLAEALKVLAADPSLRRRMGLRARELVATAYTWPAIASQVERVYQAVSDAAGRR